MKSEATRGTLVKKHGFLAATLACAAILLIPATSAAAAKVDLIVKNPAGGRVELVRSKKSVPVTMGSLHSTPLLRTGPVPLEIWAHRPEPDAPAIAETIDRSSGQPVATPVPGLAVSLDRGLSRFLRYRIKDAKGRTVVSATQSLCPNGIGSESGWGSTSATHDRRSGPLQVPIFPGWSGYGSICGEEQAESLVWMVGPRNPVYYFGAKALDLPDGDYTYEVVVNPKGTLPEKTLANNRFFQKFTLTSSARLWRNLVRGPRGLGVERSGRVRVPLRGNPGLPKLKAPTADQITGPPGALPDPVALPASKFAFERQGDNSRISFSSIVANMGDAPIALFGKRKQRTSRTMPGWQFLKGEDGGLLRRPINGFVWDNRDTHLHWHYNKLAVYELVTPDGEVVRRSGKVGFCFMPTTALRFEPVIGPVGSGTPFGFYDDDLPIDCGRRGSKRVAMSLQDGWGDEYYQGIAGQSLDVTDLPDGDYRLRITVNPEGDMAEVTPDNNISERPVRLGGSGDNRTLTVPRQGIVRGEFHPLKIRPAGRAAGAAVSSTGPGGFETRLLCGLTPR